MRLNGWQRLWVVGSTVLLGLIGYDTWEHLPTAKKIRAQAEERAFLALYEDAPIPPMTPVPPMTSQRGTIPDPPKTAAEVAECKRRAPSDAPAWVCDPVVAPSPERVASAAAIKQAAEDRIRERLLGQQARRIARGLGLWLAAIAAVYAAGWAFNWVRLGFRQQK